MFQEIINVNSTNAKSKTEICEMDNYESMKENKTKEIYKDTGNLKQSLIKLGDVADNFCIGIKEELIEKDLCFYGFEYEHISEGAALNKSDFRKNIENMEQALIDFQGICVEKEVEEEFMKTDTHFYGFDGVNAVTNKNSLRKSIENFEKSLIKFETCISEVINDNLIDEDSYFYGFEYQNCTRKASTSKNGYKSADKNQIEKIYKYIRNLEKSLNIIPEDTFSRKNNIVLNKNDAKLISRKNNKQGSKKKLQTNQNRLTRSKTSNKQKQIINSKKSYTCNVCKKKIVDTNSLKAHRGEKSFICDICHKSANKDKGQINNENKLYTCDVCSKNFAKLKSLTIHKQQHVDLK